MNYEELTPELQEDLNILSEAYASASGFPEISTRWEQIYKAFQMGALSLAAKRIHTQGSGTPQGYISIEEHNQLIKERDLTECTNCGETVIMIQTSEMCPKCLC